MLYPNDDLVLPSLWEALTGRQDVDWAEREDGGRFVDFTPDFARVWQWKDELPEQRLVCTGKHLGGKASLVSLRLLPSLYALTGRAGSAEDFREEELSPVERDVAEAVLESGPISTAELPELAGHERKRVSAATHRLQRRLVLTAAGRQERERGLAGSRPRSASAPIRGQAARPAVTRGRPHRIGLGGAPFGVGALGGRPHSGHRRPASATRQRRIGQARREGKARSSRCRRLRALDFRAKRGRPAA